MKGPEPTMEWKKPPPKRQGRPSNAELRRSLSERSAALDAIAEALRKHPGQWAQVETSVNLSTAEAYKRRGLEVRYVKTGEGQRQDIYARAMPEAPARPSPKPPAGVPKGADPWKCRVCGRSDFPVPSMARQCERRHTQ